MGDGLGLALAQKARVDEHTLQPVADGAVHQHGADGGVHAAGDGHHGASVADALAQRGDLAVDEALGRPHGCAAADVLGKIGEDSRAVGVVGFGIELKAVQPLRRVGKGRRQAVGGDGDGLQALGQLQRVDALEIAVAVRKTVEQRTGMEGDLRRAIGQQHALALRAQLPGHAPRGCAQRQNGNAKLQNRLVKGSVRRAAGQNQSLGSLAGDAFRAQRAGLHLAVKAHSAQLARHGLGLRAAEIQHQNEIVAHRLYLSSVVAAGSGHFVVLSIHTYLQLYHNARIYANPRAKTQIFTEMPNSAISSGA